MRDSSIIPISCVTSLKSKLCPNKHILIMPAENRMENTQLKWLINSVFYHDSFPFFVLTLSCFGHNHATKRLINCSSSSRDFGSAFIVFVLAARLPLWTEEKGNSEKGEKNWEKVPISLSFTVLTRPIRPIGFYGPPDLLSTLNSLKLDKAFL